MTETSFDKGTPLQMALELTPPFVRRFLLTEKEFLDKYEIEKDPVLSLADSEVLIRRSKLFAAVRDCYSGKENVSVRGRDEVIWELRDVASGEESHRWALCSGDRRLVLPDLWVIAEDVDIRLNAFDHDADEANLPIDIRNHWREILASRPLGFDEVEGLLSEFQDTPFYQSSSIATVFGNRGGQLSSLVPASRRYFERLVGRCEEGATVNEFAASSARSLSRSLTEWRARDGFSLYLLLSSHSSLTDEAGVEGLADEELLGIYEELNERGDRLSQLGAIEIGLRILSERPDIEPTLLKLVTQIRDDQIDNEASEFRILSALFMLVYGELSYSRAFASEPPFYRRMIAFAQAALIQRHLIDSDIDPIYFANWANEQRVKEFYLQSLIDTRQEPRWQPDFIQASQLKEEFIGRIMLAASRFETNIKSSDLRKLVLEKGEESLFSKSSFMKAYLPGPLEGGVKAETLMPDYISAAIEEQLKSDRIGPEAFTALVNSSLIFKIGNDEAELAAKALKEGNYRLSEIEDKSLLFAIIWGLATVAAVTRSEELGRELLPMTLRYCRDPEYQLSIVEALMIGVVAAGCHLDQGNWCEFVGEWVNALALEKLTHEDGKMMHAHLRCLCHLDPQLWTTCGKADAALSAFNDI